jgi:N-acetylmuramoyl-L-alanine amidase
VGARQGALTGSIFSQVPVVLIEMAVLTNPQDEAWIEKRENQLLYAQAITHATEAVFRKHPATN